MIKPYYEHAGITIYHGDSEEILPNLGHFDLVLTDPPYGIGMDKGFGGGGRSGGASKTPRKPQQFDDNWDSGRPGVDHFKLILESAEDYIFWGAQYFTDLLPQSNKWLVWDKLQPMPTFSSAELACTSLPGVSVSTHKEHAAGPASIGKVHPTQKPLGLMIWCLSLFPHAFEILDPFMGSGTTLLAAKELGRSCVGIEREEKYCEIAAKRLTQEVMSFG